MFNHTMIAYLLTTLILTGCGQFTIEGQITLREANDTQVATHPTVATENPTGIPTELPIRTTAETQIPILPDAFSILSADGTIMYSSHTRIQNAVSFYQEELTRAGWLPDGFIQDDEGGGTLIFVNEDGQEITLIINRGVRPDGFDGEVTAVVIDHSEGYIDVSTFE